MFAAVVSGGGSDLGGVERLCLHGDVRGRNDDQTSDVLGAGWLRWSGPGVGKVFGSAVHRGGLGSVACVVAVHDELRSG